MPLDTMNAAIKIHLMPDITVIIVFERAMTPTDSDLLQVPVRDWTIAAAASTTYKLSPYGSTLHVASRILLDPAFSRRGQ